MEPNIPGATPAYTPKQSRLTTHNFGTSATVLFPTALYPTPKITPSLPWQPQQLATLTNSQDFQNYVNQDLSSQKLALTLQHV